MSSQWRDDWQNAPRDGRDVLLKDHQDREFRLYWSDDYSIFGLGGCWTDGVCTMGEGVDFSHWREVADE